MYNNLKMSRKQYIFWILIALLLAAGVKIALLVANLVPFNSDEAIVGLMARHILQGERPIFFYGQAYMGSLDAFLIAGFFNVFGQEVWVIRFVQTTLYLLTIILAASISTTIYSSRKAGVFTALILSLPPVNTTLYTTASLGGYGEAVLIGCLVLLITIKYIRVDIFTKTTLLQSILWVGFLGFLTGLGFWANALSAIFSISCIGYLFILLFQSRNKIKLRKRSGLFLAALFGIGVGLFPWWMAAFQLGFKGLIGELLGNAVAIEAGSWLVKVGLHLANLLILGIPAMLGMRPPWEVRWLGLPLLPFILVIWGMVLFQFIRNIQNESETRAGKWLIVAITVTFLFGFLFTSFGVDPSGRYFLPIYILLAILAGGEIGRISLLLLPQIAILSLLLIFQGWGNLDCALRNPPGFTTQFDLATAIDHREDSRLIEYLTEKGINRGYSTYWGAYPLAFLSQEKILLAPELPYHANLIYSARDNRYPIYSNRVNSSMKVVYITAKNPNLDEALRTGLQNAKIQWNEDQIGDYRIYYNLSRVVTPAELLPSLSGK